jgi:hypothetical protein
MRSINPSLITYRCSTVFSEITLSAPSRIAECPLQLEAKEIGRSFRAED